MNTVTAAYTKRIVVARLLIDTSCYSLVSRPKHHNYVTNFQTDTNSLKKMFIMQVLCCVDKKGVLSFPNPIAEKVFFLRNSYHSPNPKK